MNTPTHLIFGLTAFGKAHSPAISAAALVGALIPDLSLYLLAGTHLLILDTDPRVVFGELYYSDAWQNIFRIDNSMVLWGIALVLAIMWRAPLMIALCGSAMLHLLMDFPLHHDDGRAHFWPISNWIFQSPVSYWDRRHYGDIVSVVEVAAALACCVILWRRYAGVWMPVLIAILAVAQAGPTLLFGFIF